MQISGLSASNTFSATDVLAIEVNVNGINKTYKLTGATLAAALASIGSYLKTIDVVNNLTSTDPTKVLAAPQGKVLYDKIEIKTHTVNNVTTDANGGFDSGLYAASAIIVGVNTTVGTGFITVGGTYNGQWIMQVRNFSNGTIKANSNIGNIDILYHDR